MLISTKILGYIGNMTDRLTETPRVQESALFIRAEQDYYTCQHCEKPFDPISHRWLCPHCRAKNTCCE